MRYRWAHLFLPMIQKELAAKKESATLELES